MAVAGLGSAHRLSAVGEDRFESIQRQAEVLISEFHSDRHEDCSAAAQGHQPRLFGGFSFDPGAADLAPWRPFGDALFVLPRLLYRATAQGASLTLAVRSAELASGSYRQLVDTTLELLEVLDSPEPRVVAPGVATPLLEPPPRARFESAVAAIGQAIASSQVEKVVAAHGARVTFQQPPDTTAVLRRLPAAGTLRFACRHGGACFLGATPERLVAKRGRRVVSEALAGSAVLGAAAARRLTACAKERHEHRLVVQAIERQLAPFCERLMIAAEPGVKVLRGLQHLVTPVAGSLSTPTHVLRLVAALHPTPAVAGVPTEYARQWIRDHEAAPRGWYAAPIGWFDGAGDGEFAVALRSALIDGREVRAFAGAGIVSGSDPRREYRETELKLHSILKSFGAEVENLSGAVLESSSMENRQ